MSTLRCAWIFPLAVTFETRSTFSTFAVVTRGTFLSRPRINPVRTTTAATPRTAPPMILVFFDMPSTSRSRKTGSHGVILLRTGGRKVHSRDRPARRPGPGRALINQRVLVSLSAPAPIAQLDRASDYG